MQRLAGNFLVKRQSRIYGAGGAVIELYELPNGQWQFGKGRDATVVTSLEEVKEFPPEIQQAIGAWLERIKSQPAPSPVLQGQTPVIAGQSVRDQLSQAIASMPDEVAARLLNAVTQTLGPVADSLKQGAPVNHHSDGFGQDQDVAAPGSVEAAAFQLPEGGKWCQPGNPAAGYMTLDPDITDEKGQPTMRWHPTPAFTHYVDQASDKTDVEREMDAERAKHQERELVGAGRREKRRR